MTNQIFINLPVKDLSKAKEFFGALDYSFNAQFTDDKGACLVISDTIYAMLLTEPFFKSFIKKEIADTKTSTEVILALAIDSKANVDRMMEKVLAAGGKEVRDPQDNGWMYGRAFEDLDGHIWEIVWMDPSHIDKQ